MYTCKDNLIPLLYSGEKKKGIKHDKISENSVPIINTFQIRLLKSFTINT